MDRAALLLHVRHLSSHASRLTQDCETAGMTKEAQRLGFITELLWTLRDDLEGSQRPKKPLQICPSCGRGTLIDEQGRTIERGIAELNITHSRDSERYHCHSCHHEWAIGMMGADEGAIRDAFRGD